MVSPRSSVQTIPEKARYCGCLTNSEVSLVFLMLVSRIGEFSSLSKDAGLSWLLQMLRVPTYLPH
jgi:hypothetical protein